MGHGEGLNCAARCEGRHEGVGADGRRPGPPAPPRRRARRLPGQRGPSTGWDSPHDGVRSRGRTQEGDDHDVDDPGTRRGGHRRRRGRAVPAPPAARAGAAGARLRRGVRRRRHLVLEPLPRARFDSEGYIYQYLFSEELYKDWSWSEKFPDQPEIERWMHYVTDRLDLRRDIQFSHHHHQRALRRGPRPLDASGPTAATRSTRSSSSRCAGMLSAPMERAVSRARTLSGAIFHTSRWPQEDIDLAGKRVGVVGIGATGIQVIQTIADEVEHLTVFARTPQYVLPMKNPTYGEAEQELRTRAASPSCARPSRTPSPASSTTSSTPGPTDARAAAGDPGGDLPGRLAEAVAGRVRRDVLRRGGQRGGLGVRPGEDARSAEGPAAERHAGPHRLRLRHPPGSAGDQLPRGVPPPRTSSWSACGTTRSHGSPPRGS